MTVFALALALCVGNAAALRERSMLSVNPIRRVVTMLEKMQSTVQAEGEAEEALFKKFMCYCENGGKDLQGSIEAAKTKIPQLESELGNGGAETAQLKQDIEKSEIERDAAKAVIAQATSIRKKEAAAFAKESADSNADIDAVTKAIAAIEAGVAGNFLQTSGAGVLRKLLSSFDLEDVDRKTVGSFLSSQQSAGYAPQSGQITGILKQMKDTMSKDSADSIAQEEAAIKDFTALMAAKTKLVEALQASIEEKTARLGEVDVELVNMADDLADTKESLAEDTKFLADLEVSCKTKAAEWEERSKTRADELVALADTVKLLNDDDALDLFKKTLPSPSLLQMQVSSRDVIRQARQVLQSSRRRDHRIDLIALALHGKKANFEKVLAMIDEMIALLGKEQEEDDAKKVYCEKELDESEDAQKSLEGEISKIGTAIEDSKGALATLTEEVAGLEAAIKELDGEVAKATELRKQENTAYQADLAANNAAVEIIGIAKNRMNKFYNPKLYKAESGSVGLQITARTAAGDAPAPPPETWDAYQKKGGESTGVIAMMDLLITDLEKDIAEMQVTEKDAQADYETFMKDSAEKRAEDSKIIAEKVGIKADTQANLEKITEEGKAKQAEAMANDEFLHNLHRECDWLIQNFAVRKEARAGEIDALNKAKAVLSGADYSLVQTGHASFRKIGRL